MLPIAYIVRAEFEAKIMSSKFLISAQSFSFANTDFGMSFSTTSQNFRAVLLSRKNTLHLSVTN